MMISIIVFNLLYYIHVYSIPFCCYIINCDFYYWFIIIFNYLI